MERNSKLYALFSMACVVITVGLTLLADEDPYPVVTYIQVLVCGLLLARIADKLGA